jgi:hypothetical protein
VLAPHHHAPLAEARSVIPARLTVIDDDDHVGGLDPLRAELDATCFDRVGLRARARRIDERDGDAVPGELATSERSRPTSAFNNADFPTLTGPTSATVTPRVDARP